MTTTLEPTWLTSAEYRAFWGFPPLPIVASDDGVRIDALGRRWDPRKHPRGRDGRFIEVGGIVKFFDSLNGRTVVGTGTVEQVDGDRIGVRIQHHNTNPASVGTLAFFNKRQLATVPSTEVRLDRNGNVHPDDRELPDKNGKLVRVGDTVKVEGKTGTITRIDDNSGRVVIRNDQGLHVMRRVETVDRQDAPAAPRERAGGVPVPPAAHLPTPPPVPNVPPIPRNAEERRAQLPEARPLPPAALETLLQRRGFDPARIVAAQHLHDPAAVAEIRQDPAYGRLKLEHDRGLHQVLPTTHEQHAINDFRQVEATLNNPPAPPRNETPTPSAPEAPGVPIPPSGVRDLAGNKIPSGWTRAPERDTKDFRGNTIEAYNGPDGRQARVSPTFSGGALYTELTRDGRPMFGRGQGQRPNRSWDDMLAERERHDQRIRDAAAANAQREEAARVHQEWRAKTLALGAEGKDKDGNPLPPGWQQSVPLRGAQPQTTLEDHTHQHVPGGYYLVNQSPEGYRLTRREDLMGENTNFPQTFTSMNDVAKFIEQDRKDHLPILRRRTAIRAGNNLGQNNPIMQRYMNGEITTQDVRNSFEYQVWKQRVERDRHNPYKQDGVHAFDSFNNMLNLHDQINGDKWPNEPAKSPIEPMTRSGYEALLHKATNEPQVNELEKMIEADPHLSESDKNHLAGVVNEIRDNGPANANPSPAPAIPIPQRAVHGPENVDPVALPDGWRDAGMQEREVGGAHGFNARARVYEGPDGYTVRDDGRGFTLVRPDGVARGGGGRDWPAIQDLMRRDQEARNRVVGPRQPVAPPANFPNNVPGLRPNMPENHGVVPDDPRFHLADVEQMVRDLPPDPARGLRPQALVGAERYNRNLRLALRDMLQARSPEQREVIANRVNDYFRRALDGRPPDSPRRRAIEDVQRRWDEMRRAQPPSGVPGGAPSVVPSSGPGGVDQVLGVRVAGLQRAADLLPKHRGGRIDQHGHEVAQLTRARIAIEDALNPELDNNTRLARLEVAERRLEGMAGEGNIRAGAAWHALQQARAVPQPTPQSGQRDPFGAPVVPPPRPPLPHVPGFTPNPGFTPPPPPPPLNVPGPGARVARMQPNVRGRGQFANATIRNGYGDDLKVGVIVKTNGRSGHEGYISRVHPPSNRVVIKNDQGLEIMRDADTVRAQYDIPAAPLPPPPSLHNAPNADRHDPANRVDMLINGHNNDLTQIGFRDGRVYTGLQKLQLAKADAAAGDRNAYIAHLKEAETNYHAAMNDPHILSSQDRADVRAHAVELRILIDDFDQGWLAFNRPAPPAAPAPNIDPALGVDVGKLRAFNDAHPRRIPDVGVNDAAAARNYRNVAFALDDALDPNRDSLDRQAALDRAQRLLERGVRDRVPGADDRLRQFNEIRGRAGAPVAVPRRNVGPVRFNPGPAHALARNPDANPEDYAQWGGGRAPTIAHAAIERPSAQALADAVKNSGISSSEATQLAHDIYDGHFGNLDYKVTALTEGWGSFTIAGKIHAPGQNGPVGSFSRTLYLDSEGKPKDAYNAYMRIDSGNFQGTGAASAFNRHMEDWYIANDIKSVRVEASLENGGFTWARDGFDWEDSNDAKNMYYAVRAVATSTEDLKQLDAIKARMDAHRPRDPEYPTPFELSNVGWKPEIGTGKNAQWTGKTGLIGQTWHGVKYLEPDAKTYTQLANAGRVPNPNEPIAPPGPHHYGPTDVPDAVRNVTMASLQQNDVPGFNVVRFGAAGAENAGGINATYMLTDTNTGRKYIVKEDAPGHVKAEVDAATLLRESGVFGASYVESGSSSNKLMISTYVGEQDGLRNYMLVNDGPRAVNIDNLADPSSLIHVRLFDIAVANTDRHGGNAFYAQDANGKYHLLPFDHGFTFSPNMMNDNIRFDGLFAPRRLLSEHVSRIGRDATIAEVTKYVTQMTDAVNRMAWANPDSKEKILGRLRELAADPAGFFNQYNSIGLVP